jgi:hypothetical protein
MNNPLDFSGEVPLVTGAAAGVGPATPRALAEWVFVRTHGNWSAR